MPQGVQQKEISVLCMDLLRVGLSDFPELIGKCISVCLYCVHSVSVHDPSAYGVQSHPPLTKGLIVNNTQTTSTQNLTLLADIADASDPDNYCLHCQCIEAECLCLPESCDAEADSLDSRSQPPDKPFRFEYAFESITVRGSRFKANRPIA